MISIEMLTTCDWTCVDEEIKSLIIVEMNVAA